MHYSMHSRPALVRRLWTLSSPYAAAPLNKAVAYPCLASDSSYVFMSLLVHALMPLLRLTRFTHRSALSYHGRDAATDRIDQGRETGHATDSRSWRCTREDDAIGAPVEVSDRGEIDIP